MPRLVITKGAGVGRDHAVGTECVVGRAPDVDFTIEDTLASRRHLRVARDGDAYVLSDLGSRNGTWVDGQRVQSAPLKDGSVIRAGATEFVFKQKDLLESRGPASAKAAVPAKPIVVRTAPAVAVPPTISVPTGPRAEPAPTKKPMPNVVPTKKRRGAF
jgi:pSer/pThr/pTyr-binding forkhead associated (FHA) protein